MTKASNTIFHIKQVPTSFAHANAAFVSANNVAPQVQPAFDKANAAYVAANNVAPQVQPAFDKANSAFNKANSAVHRQDFTANSGQTLFQTSGYNTGYVDVFVNGIKLYTSDFTATDGVNITINDPILESNDIVEVINWGGTAEPIARQDSYARDLSNTAWTTSNTAIINANLSFVHANASYNVSNTLASNIYSAVITANLSYVHANEAYNIANTLVQTNTDLVARPKANAAFDHANAAFATANNVAPQVQPAFNKANSAVFYDANTSNTGFLAVPNGTTAQRPASAANGHIRYNTSLGRLETYLYTGGWVSLAQDNYEQRKRCLYRYRIDLTSRRSITRVNTSIR